MIERRNFARASSLEGVYNWSYSGGSFQVELRPFGSFYCKSYPASATWAMVDKKVTVDWKKFGKYELEVSSAYTYHRKIQFDSK